MPLTLLIILLAILIILSGTFSASETALFSLSPLKVRLFEHDKSRARRIVSRLLEKPKSLLVTILMINVAVNILVQSTVASIFNDSTNLLLAVLFPLALTLVFGEVLPKSIALNHNVQISTWMGPVLYVIRKALAPVRILLTWIAGGVSRFFFFYLKREQSISLDELQHALKHSRDFGVIGGEEMKLVRGVLTLEEQVVNELKRPRKEMISFSLDEKLSHLTYLFVDEECSRIPIFGEDDDDLLGILSADHYFMHKNEINSTDDLRKHLSKPMYVPEIVKAKQLLKQFTQAGEEIAIVVDQHGTISGLIAKEDLVELVLGQIEDKRDEALDYTQSSPDVIIANGKLEIQELEDLFEVSLSSLNNMATVGGWLIEHLGDIPKAGTRVVHNDLLFYILSSSSTVVKKVYIRKLQSTKEQKEARRDR
ncbi:MAG: hypothetical protein S4CHLAM102_13770 [Chlamydiia bacterium]|nr:hypothetical protein [Chlamydiia bacterium]